MGGQEPVPVTLIEAQERGWWYLSVLADQQVIVNFFSDADLPSFDSSEFDANA